MGNKTLREWIAPTGVAFGTSGTRGLVEHMSDALCYAYAQAFLQAVAPEARTLVLGHDLRPSSPRIAAACAAAARDKGCAVDYVGALPTPAIALYAAQRGAPALVVTGSHIPFDRNGIKFYRADGEISKADEAAMLDAVVAVPAALSCSALPAVNAQAEHAYVQRYVDFLGPQALAGLTVAVYEHSSVGRDVLGTILRALGAQVLTLGRTEVFVPIDTEAVRPEDVALARQWAAERRFDAIVSTDGDADRPLIGDAQGQWLRGDAVGVLCAQFLQARVVVTPVSSNTAVERCGAFDTVVRTRIGSPYVIAGMQAAKTDGVVVGYEANGGFLLGSPVTGTHAPLVALPTRDAVLPIVAVLRSAHAQGRTVADLVQTLPQRFTASDRIQNFPTAQSQQLLAQLIAQPSTMGALMAPQAGAVVDTNTTDGLRVHFANGDIVHLRPSGNAPELRCYTESDLAQKAQSLCQACLARIKDMVQ